MKKMLVILFSFIFINSSFAQLSIGFSTGIDLKEISFYNHRAIDGNNAYWNKGFSFGGNIDYSISEKITISALFHYSHYNFDKYVNSGISIPEIRFLYAEGENSKLWRTSIEAKYFPFSQSRFNFFIFSGLGIVVEDLGTVKTHYSNMMINGNQTYITFSEIKDYFVHSLGFGVRSDIISNLFIDLSGSYYSNYNERFQTFLGIGLSYQIL